MQVVVEVYASHDLTIKPHLLLSLVLYKMVDPQSVSLQLCRKAVIFVQVYFLSLKLMMDTIVSGLAKSLSKSA